MKLEKAIEIMDDMVNPENTIGDADDKDAINLGIEALKRLEYGRLFPNRHCLRKLPGETIE